MEGKSKKRQQRDGTKFRFSGDLSILNLDSEGQREQFKESVNKRLQSHFSTLSHFGIGIS